MIVPCQLLFILPLSLARSLPIVRPTSPGGGHVPLGIAVYYLVYVVFHGTWQGPRTRCMDRA